MVIIHHCVPNAYSSIALLSITVDSVGCVLRLSMIPLAPAILTPK